MPAAPRARMQDRSGDEQLHSRDEPEELAGSLIADFLWLQAQGAVEEALLEEPPSADGESPLRPGGE